MRQPECAARSLIDQNDWIQSDVEGHRLSAGLTMEVFNEYNLLEKKSKERIEDDENKPHRDSKFHTH